MLQLLDLNKNKIAGLIEYKDLSIESTLDTGDKTLTFTYSKFSRFYEDIKEEAYIRTKTDEFVIKAKEVQNDESTFTCTLNVEDLEGNIIDRFESKEQTIKSALNLALVNTGWTVGNCDIKKRRTVRMSNSNSWEIIQEIKKTYRIEIQFDTLNKKINVYEHIGSDKGTYFIDSLNLTALSIQSNSYDFATRIIPIGKDGLTIESINNGKNYVENYQYSNKVKTIYWKDERYTIAENLKEDAEAKLNEISKPYRAYSASIINLAEINDKYKNILDYKLGDTITLISKDNKIREKQRIVKIKEYPNDHSKDTVELANAILRFEDIQKTFKDTTDAVDNITSDNGTVDGSTIDSIKVNQIEDFKANVIEVTNLEALNANISNLHANKADIQELNAVKANVGTLNATKANITELNSVKANIETLQADKADINLLNAESAKIKTLESDVANIDTLVSEKASIKDLNALQINTEKLLSEKASIKDLDVINGHVTNLDAVKANIKDLTATNANIDSLKSDTADIKTLLNGNLSSENIQSAGITSDKLTIADGFIKNAMINSIVANKIVSGKLDTSKVNIISNDGNLVIKDNTIQIKDTSKVRVQIGKDNNGDYNIYVWDKSGNLMFDATGITEHAIKNNIIRNDMISDTANIDGSKLNIESVIASVNDSKSTIKASRINLDKNNQTLDIAFSKLQTSNDENSKSISDALTKIEVQQGQIKSTIENSKIIEGKQKTLEDNYNRTTATINSFENTLGSHKTLIDSATGKINAVETKTNTIKKTLDSTVETLTQTNKTVSDNKTLLDTKTSELKKNIDGLSANITHVQKSTEGKINTLNSTTANLQAGLNGFTANLNSLNSKTETITTNLTNFNSNLNNKIDNIKIGGRNLIRKAFITNRGCTTFNYDEETNTWACVAPAGSNSWGYGFTISSNKKIVVEKGRTLMISLEVNPSIDCTWNADINNSYTGNTGGNDNDDISLRKTSNKSLKANLWTKCWFSYTAKTNVSYDLIEQDSTWGIITTDASSSVSFKFRNVKAEYGNKATDWTPAPEDLKEYSDNVAKAKANLAQTIAQAYADGKVTAEEQKRIDEAKKNLDTAISKANAAESNAKTYADTKKQEAINSASTDATNKANNALNNAKSYANAQITTVNSRVSSAESSINVLKNQISSKVSQSDIDKTVSNIQIGGRNLWKHTKEYDGSKYSGWVDNTNAERITTAPHTTIDGFGVQRIDFPWHDMSQRVPIESNTEYTLSAYIKWENAQGEMNFYTNTGTKSGTSVTQQVGTTTYKRVAVTFNSQSGTVSTCRFECSSNTPYLIYGLKLEKGNKATDWTPAPEDTDQTIVDNIKIVTEKINNVGSELKQTKDSITASVNSLNSTTKTITTNLTAATNDLNSKINSAKTDAINNSKSYAEQKRNEAISSANSHADSIATSKSNEALSNAKTYADTKKQEAINSANSDATNKANNALNNAKTYTNTQITTVNSNLSKATSEINVLKNQISTKVSQSDIDRTVNNIKIGGRNLLLHTDFSDLTPNSNIINKWNVWGNIKVYINQGKNSYNLPYTGYFLSDNHSGFWQKIDPQRLKKNTEYVLSIKHGMQQNVKGFSCYMEYWNNGVRVEKTALFSMSGQTNIEKRIYPFKTINKDYTEARFCFDYKGWTNEYNCLVILGETKIEEGTKATDWTPAPEDVNQAISDNVKTVTERINTVESTFTQKTNSINAAVSSVQSTLNTKANGNTVSSMQSQLSSLNLGLNGIKTEVSKKTDKSSIISAINQSAESIKINASKIALDGITTFSNNGLKAVEVKNNSVRLFNWKKNGEFIGMLTSTVLDEDNSKPFMNLANRKNSAVAIGYTENDVNFKSYIVFDKFGVAKNPLPITFYENISLNGYSLYFNDSKKNKMLENSDGKLVVSAKHGLAINDIDSGKTTANLDSDRVGFSKWNQNYYYTEFSPNAFNLADGNGKGYMWKKSNERKIWTGDGISLGVQGDLTVRGKKNRVVETSYGNLTLNAVESTECWFTDMLIDQSKTDSNGDCIIWFDDKFLQTVNTRYKYKIDLTPIGEFASNGKLTYVRVVEKTEKYFKVRGTPDTIFDWTITAKQKGYERDRLEKTR